MTDTEKGGKKPQEVCDGKAQDLHIAIQARSSPADGSSDKPSSEVARELGVRRNQLYKWKEQLTKRGSSAFPSTGGSRPNDELTRLRQELERVKEERDILRKAAAYFPNATLAGHNTCGVKSLFLIYKTRHTIRSCFLRL